MFNLKNIAEKYKLIMVDVDNTLFNLLLHTKMP